jgi:poly [ADP-ribose] polymerase
MEIAQKMIDDGTTKDADGNSINPIDGHFQSLNLKSMDPIASATDEFSKLQEYVTSTHGHTHGGYRSRIKHAFRVERQDEAGRWSDAGYDNLQDGERLLLWHGSRSTNFAGILKQGLRIAPPEAPVTGYMFGKVRYSRLSLKFIVFQSTDRRSFYQGVYFADVRCQVEMEIRHYLTLILLGHV